MHTEVCAAAHGPGYPHCQQPGVWNTALKAVGLKNKSEERGGGKKSVKTTGG